MPILKDTSAEVAAKICAGLAPEKLTSVEAADVTTLNYAARYGTRFKEICKQED